MRAVRCHSQEVLLIHEHRLLWIPKVLEVDDDLAGEPC